MPPCIAYYWIRVAIPQYGSSPYPSLMIGYQGEVKRNDAHRATAQKAAPRTGVQASSTQINCSYLSVLLWPSGAQLTALSLHAPPLKNSLPHPHTHRPGWLSPFPNLISIASRWHCSTKVAFMTRLINWEGNNCLAGWIEQRTECPLQTHQKHSLYLFDVFTFQKTIFHENEACSQRSEQVFYLLAFPPPLPSPAPANFW